MTEQEKQELLKSMEKNFPELTKKIKSNEDKAYKDLIEGTPAEDLFNHIFKPWQLNN